MMRTTPRYRFWYRHVLAFSGNGAYRNRGACGMIPKEGPVPAGKYWIVDRPQGGLKSQLNTVGRDIYNHFANGATFKHSEWFALWRDDWGSTITLGLRALSVAISVCIRVLSEGCITLPHDSDFAMLRNALLRSQRIDVPCMRNLQAYGTIEVISNGKTCP